MNLSIDAQLPNLLSAILNEFGYSALYLENLPNSDESSDSEIIEFADKIKAIVVTKDSEFFHSHTLINKPNRLLLISTGNIKNKELLELFRKNHLKINELFSKVNFVEINSLGIASHD